MVENPFVYEQEIRARRRQVERHYQQCQTQMQMLQQQGMLQQGYAPHTQHTPPPPDNALATLIAAVKEIHDLQLQILQQLQQQPQSSPPQDAFPANALRHWRG